MIVYVLNKSRNNLAGFARQTGAQVWTNVNDVPATVLSAGQFNLLERVDAIILEIAHPAEELLYVLAQAIILRKPTLCLYPTNNIPIDIVQHLSKKTIPTTVKTKSYETSAVGEMVQKFLAQIDQSIVVADIPHIKFTLRLTPSLERYLDWLNAQQQINKADFIRQMIKRHLDENTVYQEYLNKLLG